MRTAFSEVPQNRLILSQSVRLKIVGEEDVLFAGFWVAIDDFPYLFGIDPGAFINGKVPDGIRKRVFGKSSFPPLSLEFDIAFRPDHEEGFYLVNLVEVPEIVVASVEDIVSILLVRYLRHHFAVMHRRWRNMHLCRDLSLDIIKGVHLDSALVFAEFGPPEHLKTQVESRGIEGIDVAVQVENLGRALLSGHVDHVEGELFKDAAVPIFVGF